MKDFDPNKLTEDELRLVHNLYNKKWREKHKASVSYSNVEYYKKCKGIKKSLVPNSVEVSSIVFNKI